MTWFPVPLEFILIKLRYMFRGPLVDDLLILWTYLSRAFTELYCAVQNCISKLSEKFQKSLLNMGKSSQSESKAEKPKKVTHRVSSKLFNHVRENIF